MKSQTEQIIELQNQCGCLKTDLERERSYINGILKPEIEQLTKQRNELFHELNEGVELLDEVSKNNEELRVLMAKMAAYIEQFEAVVEGDERRVACDAAREYLEGVVSQ